MIFYSYYFPINYRMEVIFNVTAQLDAERYVPIIGKFIFVIKLFLALKK